MFERDRLMERIGKRNDIAVEAYGFTPEGFPVRYKVDYYIRSICAVESPETLGKENAVNPPVFADHFIMDISVPPGYPAIDSMPEFRFRTVSDKGEPIPHPWHPNIRWFGDFAGRVCMNFPDTYVELAWGVERVARYLKYELYHALNELPYPEDQTVAAWVIRQGEPYDWIYFN